jgi:hypothetical protein
MLLKKWVYCLCLVTILKQRRFTQRPIPEDSRFVDLDVNKRHRNENNLPTYRAKVKYIAHLRQECHKSKFGIFELLV